MRSPASGPSPALMEVYHRGQKASNHAPIAAAITSTTRILSSVRDLSSAAVRALSFGSIADRYDRFRPGPPGAVDWALPPSAADVLARIERRAAGHPDFARGATLDVPMGCRCRRATRLAVPG